MKQQYIEFKVSHQQITRTDDFFVVGGSQNYLKARFSFCEDWDGEQPVAVFTSGHRAYSVLIDGGECFVPWEVLQTKRFFVGCMAGARITSNAAEVAVCPCGVTEGVPAEDPTPSIYDQILAKLSGLEVVTEAQIEAAVAEYMEGNPAGVPIATAERLGVIRVGSNLKITEDGVLSVVTTNEAERDNTKPITSAGVYTQLGNIEVLLAAL